MLLFLHVNVLWREGPWCVGVVLHRFVRLLEFASYLRPTVCSELLQVLSGRVLGGGDMGLCVSLSEAVI